MKNRYPTSLLAFILLTFATSFTACDEAKKPYKRPPTWRTKTVTVTKEKQGIEGVTKTKEKVTITRSHSYRPGQMMRTYFRGKNCYYSGSTKTQVFFVTIAKGSRTIKGSDRCGYGESAASAPFFYFAEDTSKPFRIHGYFAQVQDNTLWIVPADNRNIDEVKSIIPED